jgi:hypothetical protein
VYSQPRYYVLVLLYIDLPDTELQCIVLWLRSADVSRTDEFCTCHFLLLLFLTNMSNNGDSHNQPMDEQPVIDDGLTVDLKRTNGTKPVSIGLR